MDDHPKRWVVLHHKQRLFVDLSEVDGVSYTDFDPQGPPHRYVWDEDDAKWEQLW